MKRMNEDYRKLQDSDIELFSDTFHKYIESFDCNAWTNGAYTNNFFHNCANRAFEDFLEFCRTCWGIPLKQFKKKYIHANDKDVVLLGLPYKTKEGWTQQIRFKSVGCFFVYFPVSITGHKENLVFPVARINVWDLDSTINLPLYGETHRDLSPGFYLAPNKEQCIPTPENTIIHMNN